MAVSRPFLGQMALNKRKIKTLLPYIFLTNFYILWPNAMEITVCLPTKKIYYSSRINKRQRVEDLVGGHSLPSCHTLSQKNFVTSQNPQFKKNGFLIHCSHIVEVLLYCCPVQPKHSDFSQKWKKV